MSKEVYRLHVSAPTSDDPISRCRGVKLAGEWALRNRKLEQTS